MLGSSLVRQDAFDKVLGKALYANDIPAPSALYLKAVSSTVAHADLVSVDGSLTLGVPGVIGLLTSAHIPGAKCFGKMKKDQPVLPSDRIRYLGEIIAIVVAENERAAEFGASLVKVNTRPLETVSDPLAALKAGAPVLHPGGNVNAECTWARGNVEDAMRDADVVIENWYHTGFVDHAYIEPDASLAYPKDGRIVVHSQSQDSYYARREIAAILDLPEDSVVIKRPVVGGGFGGRTGMGVDLYTALAAKRYMRPAVLLLTREEVFACTTKRYGFSIKYTTAARNDGRISAVDIDILIDGGAYTSSGPAVARRACFHAPGPYCIPNVRSRARCAFTNNPVCGPMRGFGVPQTTWAHETQVDILARRLGMDPFEIRKLNALKPGLETTCGQRLDSAGLIETLEMARHKYAEIFRDEPVDLPDGLVRGVGVASMYYGIGKTGASFPSTARVELHPGGKVRVFICAADIGQGSDQALTQIAAHALGVPFDQIELLTNDTDLCPDGGPTVASRLTYDAGNAVLKACEEARRLERSGQNQASAPICSSATFRAATSEPDQETGRGVPWPTYAFATQVAEVAVNPKTGETSVLRVVAAHDVGRAVNPSIVTSQIEGGVVMGTGFALMEEFRPGITGGFREYMIPGALDAPPVCSIIVEDPEPTGPFGAKGVAEPSLIPTAPAITNAIYDAVSVRIKELPATPERLYGELRQRAEIAE